MALDPGAELVVLIAALMWRSPAAQWVEGGHHVNTRIIPPCWHSCAPRHLGLVEGLFDRSKLQERVLFERRAPLAGSCGEADTRDRQFNLLSTHKGLLVQLTRGIVLGEKGLNSLSIVVDSCMQ